MNWKEVNKQHLESWLVVEAINAETQNNKRIIEDVDVIEIFNDSMIAYKKYQELHRKDPSRELYVVYSDWDKLSFEELNWKGLRGVVLNQSEQQRE